MNKKIMLAEDDKNLNELACEYLTAAGFTIYSFEDGKRAKDEIESNPEIDLFIFDIMLPNISGLELLQTVKRESFHKEKPVIMLTALKDEYTQLISFEGLADDYITKPFSLKILVKRVEAIVRRTYKANTIHHLGGILIDNDNYEVYENGNKLPLTLREFELLKYLAENKNKVISRQQLLNSVWGYSYFGDERIVDAHIKNIRKKMNEAYITTVKGVGYRFEGDF